MNVYRSIIALLLLAALVLPQATPVQSAPRSVDSTLNLQPGTTITIICPTRLVRKSGTRTSWKLICRRGTLIPTATPTAGPTATATQTPEPTGTPTTVLRSRLWPGDTLTLRCPTRLVKKSGSRTRWKVVCRPAAASPTPTSTAGAGGPGTQTSVPPTTQTSAPAATHTSAPAATHTSAPAATHTSMPTATRTSVPTATRTPVATATGGSGGSNQPYKDAPACSTHDETKWHSLWDYQRGCHYDHTHGDDPALANAYFGPAGALWGGQTISYPFATSPHENHMKHGGYKYSVKTPQFHAWPPCGVDAHTDDSQTGNNCIKASRIQYHIVGGTMDTLARAHSYYMELYVCKYPAYTDCGVIKIGGHADFAALHAPHYSDRVVRPGGTIDFGDGIVMSFDADGPDLPAQSGEPYVFMIPYSAEELSRRRANPPRLPNATMDQWSMNDLDCEPRPAGSPCRNRYARFLAQVGDAWNLLDKQNPNNVRWICKGEPGCQYNGSMIGVNELALHILQEWQPAGNGFVTLTGYTDRWGNPRFDNTCTSVSVDCVPLVLNHLPTGYAATRMNDQCECVVYEYDIYFNGVPSNWIKFPN